MRTRTRRAARSRNNVIRYCPDCGHTWASEARWSRLICGYRTPLANHCDKCGGYGVDRPAGEPPALIYLALQTLDRRLARHPADEALRARCGRLKKRWSALRASETRAAKAATL